MAFNCGCMPYQPSPDIDNRGVFCSGPLLDRVQRSNLYPDCKHFVDMSCVYTPAQTMADYELFRNCARNDGSLEFLQMFVEKHFIEPGPELEPWTPPDWKCQPSFISKVNDPAMKEFAAEVNLLWKQLGRRVTDNVQQNPQLYSIIYLPKPFIIPDANCREYRYWDSFWIIRGLLQCGMHQTARGMIENYLVLVQQYGYVPACGRIYSAGRTHPPLLIMMVKSYVEVTKDEQFAIQSLPLLETEFETFVSKHSVEVKGRTMYQYRVEPAFPGPRPEAYREDLAAAEHLQGEEAREAFYTELKSASESGQEFSSRWFVAEGGCNEASLKDTKPSAIVPVELNAIIFRSGKILAEFNRKAGNIKKADEYQDRSCGLVKAIRDVLWNKEVGIWLDYDVVNKQSRNYFCCTNFAPLWARAFPLVDTDCVSKSVMEYIRTNKLDEQPGGVPYTMYKKAGEKWDNPNVFPPMMFMMVEGLDNLGTRASKSMSRKWAHRWVKSNYMAFKSQGFMYEKYSCEVFGTAAAGSDPKQVPVGYGWTNGVIIEFLCKYGREISITDVDECNTGRKKNSCIITSVATMQGLNKAGCKCNKSTAAMGAQSAANCAPEQQRTEDCCSCAVTRTRSQTVQTERQAEKQGNCACGAESGGGGARSPRQSRQSECESEQLSERSQQQQRGSRCGGCKSSKEQPKQHKPGCPSGEDQQRQQPCKPVSCAPSKQQQQQQTDSDCECQAKAMEQLEQLQKQTACYQEQLKLQAKQGSCACGAGGGGGGAKSSRLSRQSECETEQPLERCQQQQQQQQKGSCCGGCKSSKEQPKQQKPGCPSDEDQQKQQPCKPVSKQHKPGCPSGEDQQKQQPCKPVSCAPSKQQQQQQTDSECECQAKAKEQLEQLQKQTACYQEQQRLQAYRQQQQEQWQRESQQQKDCTKPKAQDCSEHTKKPAQGGCGCEADEEQQRMDKAEELTGHYAPLADKATDARCSEPEPEPETQCFGCDIDDCPDAPEEDCDSNEQRKQPKSHKSVTTEDNCSPCSEPAPRVCPEPAQSACLDAEPSIVCPHCGGIYSGATLNVSMQTVGTQKTSPEQDCSCSGGGGQQIRGMTSIGLQSGNSQVATSRAAGCCGCSADPCADPSQLKSMSNVGQQTGNCKSGGGAGNNQSSRTKDDCVCSGGGGASQMKNMNSNMAKSGTCSCADQGAGGRTGQGAGGRAGSGTGGRAGQSDCGPCQAHKTAEYGPGHGPTPRYNKQFPLADPVTTDGACPPKKKEEKKKKCCNCDEKE